MFAGGQHGDHDFGVAYRFRGRRSRFGASLRQCLDGIGHQIIDKQVVAGFDQIERHGRAHMSQADKCDASHVSLLLL